MHEQGTAASCLLAAYQQHYCAVQLVHCSAGRVITVPLPGALVQDAVAALRQQLAAHGSTNLYDLLHTLGAWETRLVQASAWGNSAAGCS